MKFCTFESVNEIAELAKKNDSYFREVAFNICKCKFKADDLVQEMYLKLYRYDEEKLKNIYSNGVLKFLCVRMINQLFIDSTRKRKEHIGIEHLTLAVEEVKKDPRIDKVQSLLENLYWFDQRLFETYVFDNHSMRSLAGATGIPIRRIFTTINKVKDEIKEKL